MHPVKHGSDAAWLSSPAWHVRGDACMRHSGHGARLWCGHWSQCPSPTQKEAAIQCMQHNNNVHSVMNWLSLYPIDICQLLIISKRLPFRTIFQITHLPSHPNTLIHDTTQNITVSTSCDQMLLSLNSLIGDPNCSMDILGLCAITIPIFLRGIFCQRNLSPNLKFTC